MAVLVHQIRPSVAGSSAEVFWTGAIPIEPLRLRNAEAGAVGETCASVSATNSPVWHGAAEGAPRPGGECGSIPRRAPAHSDHRP
jgi:hypothetical protein